MALPLDDKLFEEGFCWGVYEITVDEGPRIRLPRAAAKVLEDHEVERLWRFPDPSGPRMILCPDVNRNAYVKAVKQSLAGAKDHGMAYRRFVCVGEPVTVVGHGRVSITSAVSNHMGITAGRTVILIGIGPWYELWKQDDWFGSTEGDTEEQKSV